MYVVIEWFGSAPLFATSEEGDLLVWADKVAAKRYADDEVQIGTVVEVPSYAEHRLVAAKLMV